MTEPHDPPPGQTASAPAPADPSADPSGRTRRAALRLGVLGASAIVTIRPALAQTAGSVLACEIPVPDPANRGWIDPDGKVVPANTPGAFPPAARAFRGEEVKAAMRSSYRSLPGTEADQSRAYLRYIGRLQGGQSGFTCFASLQMQNR